MAFTVIEIKNGIPDTSVNNAGDPVVEVVKRVAKLLIIEEYKALQFNEEIPPLIFPRCC